MMNIDIFISYAAKDAGEDVLQAAEFAKWLETEGYTVFWDLHLHSGNAQKQLIDKAGGAKSVIALWSPRSDKSRNVYLECALAAATGKLLPIIIEGDENGLPPEWRNLAWMKLTEFEAQKEAIFRKLPKPSRPKAAAAPIENTDSISIVTELATPGLLIGRDAELAVLGKSWASTAPGAALAGKTNVAFFHAIGGAGKTALMQQFLSRLTSQDFAGAEKVYAWSAYSQGSGDNRTAIADAVITEALAFFGYAGPAITDAAERGRRLAEIVAGQRALVILDGLEPLQDLPFVNGGRLKDRGLAALVNGLAVHNKGLLIITSRQELPELPTSHEPRIISQELNRMGIEAGVTLLAALGVDGKRAEMERAVEDVLGHALSLSLLGAYLSAVHGGDVNGREQFRLGEIEDSEADFIGDATARYARRAARIMEGAIDRLGAAEAAILHMAGLFDRPAEREALEALLAEPAIAGLTDAFHALPPAQRKGRWNVAVERLRKLKLIAAEDRHQPGALDAHPIVRAHFGDRLKRLAPEAYAEAHSRLYDFYRYQGLPQAFRTPEVYGVLAFVALFPQVRDQLANVIATREWPEGWGEVLPPSLVASNWPKLQEAATLIGTAVFDAALTAFLPGDLDAMRPCFAAIVHGCAAGRHQEAFSEVYVPRVNRGNEAFIKDKLGALNADLAALAHFFDALWTTPAARLGDTTKALLLNFSGYALRALGRLREAVEPFGARLKTDVASHDWHNAAIAASNVSELRLSIGDIAEAVTAARDSIAHADASGNAFWRMASRTTLADAMHQHGEAAKALAAFVEAEAMQAELQPGLPKLYSLQGYQYCDLLLAMGQTRATIESATQALRWAKEANRSFLDVAFNHLALGRAYAMLVFDTEQADGADAAKARSRLDDAVDDLRRAGQEDDLPRGLLARATFLRSQGGFAAAAADLAEAQDIASRGEMRLHLTDWRLESARLALAQFAATNDPVFRSQAETHRAEAAALIAATGYKRRLAECAAILACLDGTLPAHSLAPDRDAQTRPIWHQLTDRP